MMSEEEATITSPEPCLDYGFIHVSRIWDIEGNELPLMYFKLTSPGEQKIPSSLVKGIPTAILRFLRTKYWDADSSDESNNDPGDDEGISCGGIELTSGPKRLDSTMLSCITRTGLYYRAPPRHIKEERHWQRLGGRVFVHHNGDWSIVEFISEGEQTLNGFEVERRSSSDNNQPHVREGHYRLDLTMTPPKWTWCIGNFVGLKNYRCKGNCKKGKKCSRSCVVIDVDMDEDQECQSRFIALGEKQHYAPVEKIDIGADVDTDEDQCPLFTNMMWFKDALKPYTPCMRNSNVSKFYGGWIWEFKNGWYRPYSDTKQFFDIIKVPGSSAAQYFDEKIPESRRRRILPTREAKRKLECNDDREAENPCKRQMFHE